MRIVLICNLASLLFGAWLPSVAVLFNYAGWFLMDCIRVTSQWSAHWPAAYFYVPMPGLFTIGLYYFALLSLFTGWLLKSPRRIWRISSLILLCLAWCGLWLHNRPDTRLTILPLGEGYGAYLRSSHSSADWLIDCGNDTSLEMVTIPYLHAQGVNRLSHLVLTHGNIHYIGGGEPLMKLFRPKTVLLDPILSHSPDYRSITSFVSSNLPPQPIPRPGDRFGPWTVLHPDPAKPSSRADDNAIVLLGNIDSARVLLLSNLGRTGQNALLSRTNDLHADILVAATSETSGKSDESPLSETLLKAIQPRVIVIHDSPSHPASDLLQKQLERRHVPILYTRQTRAVTLTTRHNHWQLTAMNGTVVSDGQSP